LCRQTPPESDRAAAASAGNNGSSCPAVVKYIKYILLFIVCEIFSVWSISAKCVADWIGYSKLLGNERPRAYYQNKYIGGAKTLKEEEPAKDNEGYQSRRHLSQIHILILYVYAFY